MDAAAERQLTHKTKVICRTLNVPPSVMKNRTALLLKQMGGTKKKGNVDLVIFSPSLQKKRLRMGDALRMAIKNVLPK